MNFDALTDRFVEHINAAPREPFFDFEVPQSVRAGTSPVFHYEVPQSVRVGTSPDAIYGMWDWNIKPFKNIDWIEDLEARLLIRFPKSFRSLITRYIFPQFDFGPLQFLANTPEGVDKLYELRTGIFEDKYLSDSLLQNGFIQFARAAGGGYDPICFDANNKSAAIEYSIVNIDHEGILCHDKINITKVLAPSFHELIKQHLKA